MKLVSPKTTTLRITKHFRYLYRFCLCESKPTPKIAGSASLPKSSTPCQQKFWGSKHRSSRGSWKTRVVRTSFQGSELRVFQRNYVKWFLSRVLNSLYDQRCQEFFIGAPFFLGSMGLFYYIWVEFKITPNCLLYSFLWPIYTYNNRAEISNWNLVPNLPLQNPTSWLAPISS